MNKLAEFRKLAAPDEWAQLARLAGTNTIYLTHLARGYGRRVPKVSLAVRIESGTRQLARLNPKLPVVTCVDLATGYADLECGK